MERELQIAVVTMFAEGKNSKEIGESIGKSSRTIEYYVAKMLKWNDCKNITHLVAEFVRNKIIK